MKPREDPADRAARLRERRITEADRTVWAERGALRLTTDLRSLYGLRQLTQFSAPTPATSAAQVKPLRS